MEQELTINENANRYEMTVEGHTAFMDFRKNGDIVSLIHTEVPPEIAGKGVGGKLVSKVLDCISNENLKVNPLCGFVDSYIRKNPQYNSIVARQ